MEKKRPEVPEASSVVTHPLQSEASSVANIMRRLHKPQTIAVKQLDVLEAEVLLVLEGFRATSVKPFLDEYLDSPERRVGTAELADLASFIAHVNRFADSHTAIFADRNEASPTLLAVLDYHEEGATGSPRFGKHRSRYAFPLSDEWKAWKEKDGKPFGQQEFAEFIENRLADVLDPGAAGAGPKEFQATLGCTFATAAKLLELSRGLEVRVGAHVKQAVRLESGETQLMYHEAHSDSGGAPLKIPSAFVLALPVFRSGALYQVPVRLRYRAGGGTMTWFYELYREDAVFEHAFEEACARTREETKLPVFMGKPEA